MSEKTMQVEFVAYLRTETRKQSLIALICIVLITLLLSGALFQKREDEETSSYNITKLLCLHAGITALTMGLSVIFSFSNKHFIELIGISFMLPNLIIIFLCYMVQDFFEMDSTTRNIQLQIFVLS